MEELKNWIKENPLAFGGVLSLMSFVFGVCLVLGAVKDWDWLYEPDEHYQNNWTMGADKPLYGEECCSFYRIFRRVVFYGNRAVFYVSNLQ